MIILRKLFSVRLPAVAISLAFMLGVSLCSVSPVEAQLYKGTQLVKADLLADTTTVTAGKPFLVGLRMKMAPHWHSYWQNSGDAGLPTKIDWQLPEGFKAGPILWPIPVRIDNPGDIVNYGYNDQVVLLTEITPPTGVLTDDISIKAKASWLVCAELCVPGDANLSLNLLAGGEATAANSDVFKQARALLPKPLTDTSLAEVSVTRQVEGENLVFDFGISVPEAAKVGAEFFPVPPEDVDVGHPATRISGEGDHRVVAQVTLPLTTNPKGANAVSGVLVLTTPTGDRVGYMIPAADASSAIVPAAKPKERPPTRTAGSAPLAETTGDTPATGSLFHYLLLGLVGGLVLNFMPCVLPVISLKLFSFVKQANEDPARVLKLGLAYAAGVFAWFLGFAAMVIGLKAAGHEVGYAFHLQSPWFIVGLCTVVFVFSLNLLGVFEFILPSAVGGILSDASQRNEGYAGAFFQGVLATVLGSACTAPVFGPALAFAFSQSPFVILVMFAAFAAGMSSPFVLLAAKPQWLVYLPRPGVWMERVKQATGFLMLATVLWLLSILGAMKGSDAVVWMGVLLLVLSVVCWIQGSFNTLLASSGTRALSYLAMAALLLGGGTLGIRQISAAQLPAVSDTSFADQLQAALKSDQPVFVDFTASWCVNCKVNERLVLSTPPIQQAFKTSNTIFLTADWTNGAPDITAQLKQYGRFAVPLYVIYPADRARAPILLPELLTQEVVVDGLKSAAAVGSSKVAVTDTAH